MEGGLEKSLHTLIWGGRSNPFLRNIFQVLQRMNSVKCNFIMLINEMESYVRIGERDLKKSYVPLHGGRGIKNYQNHPSIINEWPIISLKIV